MPATHPHRIVRRAVMVLGVVVLLVGAWLLTREHPDIHRSRAIRLGMTRREVESVMGSKPYIYETPSGHFGLLFGSAQFRIEDLRLYIWRQTGIDAPGRQEINDWPVRIRFDDDGRVDRIERGSDVEENIYSNSHPGYWQARFSN